MIAHSPLSSPSREAAQKPFLLQCCCHSERMTSTTTHWPLLGKIRYCLRRGRKWKSGDGRGADGLNSNVFSRCKVSATLGVHLKISAMLIGSFVVCMNTGMKRPGFSATSCEPGLLLISPKHSSGRLWITCTHPCLNCSNMLEVDQTEWLSERTADRASPVGCWGSDMKTGKEQRLVGTVKDARTTAAHQNSFSETGMK